MGEVGTAFGGVPMPSPLAQFLGRVLAWCAPGEPDSYVNIHGFTPKGQEASRQFPRKGGGRAYVNLTEFGQIEQFLWMLDQSGDEAFYCISTRSGFKGTDRTGNRKATRAKTLNRPVRLKAWVLDLDVKAKGYASQRAALAAVLPFLEGLGLVVGPIVDTGYGLHVYLTIPVGITPQEWQPLANALIEAARRAGIKFDVAVTRDDDRILRVPGSRNLKDPADPKLCRLLSLGADNQLAHLRQVLAPFMGATPTSPHRANGHAPLDLSFLPPRPPIIGAEADRARAEVARNRVVTGIDDLIAACPVVADSDWRGGNGDREPLWKEFANLCHYVDNGRDFFHDLSSDDPRYDEDATDQKYDERVLMGWPLCSTIAEAGGEAICQTCPHYREGKSPLHFATRGDPPGEAPSGQVNGHVNGHVLSAAPFTTAAPIRFYWVPHDYNHDSKHYLWTPEGELAFLHPVHYVGLVYEDGRQMMEFIIDRGTADADPTGHFLIDGTATASRAEFAKAMATYGGQVNPQLSNKGRRVEQDLITQIRSQRAAVISKRCGWSDEGFVYGDFIYTEQGAKPTSNKTEIGPRGTLADWKEVVDRYVGIGCTDMEVFMASAFAAPLMVFTQEDGGIIFTHSSKSGRGKSASLFIAASVWYPRTFVVKVGTANFALSRMATLNNLPFYFDELIPSSREARTFSDLIKAVTGGSEPGRLQRSSKEMAQRQSRTMMGANANRSLIEISKVADTDAQAARVLEYEMPDTFAKHQKNFGDVAQHKQIMDDNCGTAGAMYAAFLGKNRSEVKNYVAEEMNWWQRRMGAGDGERYWCCSAAALMVGAQIARALNLMAFDTKVMRQWLMDWFQHQRTVVSDMSTNADDPDVQLQRVLDFLNDNIRSRIITKDMPKKGSGRSEVTNREFILNSNEFVARIAREEGRAWISETKLSRYCSHASRGYSYAKMKQVLMKAGYCDRLRTGRFLGAGTNLITQKEIVLEFNFRSDPRLSGFSDQLELEA